MNDIEKYIKERDDKFNKYTEEQIIEYAKILGLKLPEDLLQLKIAINDIESIFIYQNELKEKYKNRKLTVKSYLNKLNN